MFGTETWKDDLKERGPRRTLPCDHPESIVHESGTNSDIMQVIIEEEINVLEESATVLVVCGLKGILPCNTLETVEKMDNMGEVFSVGHVIT